MARLFFVCLFRLAGEEENLFLPQHRYFVWDKQAIVACHCPNGKSKANINASYSDFSLIFKTFLYFTSLFSYCKQILRKNSISKILSELHLGPHTGRGCLFHFYFSGYYRVQRDMMGMSRCKEPVVAFTMQRILTVTHISDIV